MLEWPWFPSQASKCSSILWWPSPGFSLFDRHSQFESPVTCNCTCEIDVKAVPCEIPSWGGELLKLAVTLGIGVAIGLGRITLRVVLTGCRFLGDLAYWLSGGESIAPARVSDTGVGEGLQRSIPGVSFNPSGAENRDRAQEQLALLRRRREGGQ